MYFLFFEFTVYCFDAADVKCRRRSPNKSFEVILFVQTAFDYFVFFSFTSMIPGKNTHYPHNSNEFVINETITMMSHDDSVSFRKKLTNFGTLCTQFDLLSHASRSYFCYSKSMLPIQRPFSDPLAKYNISKYSLNVKAKMIL